MSAKSFSNALSIKGTIIETGSGSPESVITAPVGSFYMRTDSATLPVYFKTSGSGNTGWTALPLGVFDVWTYSIAGPVAVASGTIPIGVPYGSYTLLGVRTWVTTAPTGASLICDLNKNGTTVFSTQGNRPTIANGATDSGAIVTPNITSLTAGDILTLDVDQKGSTVAGSNLGASVVVQRLN